MSQEKLGFVYKQYCLFLPVTLCITDQPTHWPTCLPACLPACLHGAVFLEKPTSSQLVKKFLTFYWTWRSITAFTKACHLSLFWVIAIQSIPPNLAAWRSILILSSHICHGSSKRSFPSGFQPKPCVCLSSPAHHYMCYMPSPSHFSWFDHLNNVWLVVHIICLLIM